MTRLNSEIKVEISVVLNYYFFIFDFINKNISKTNFTFFLFFNWIEPSTKENRMRKYIAYSLNIDADRSISPHDIAVNIVIEWLRCLGLKNNLYFCLSLSRNYSIHRFNNKRIRVLKLTFYWLFIKCVC